MFEDSLFESTQHYTSARGRWTTAVSIAAQGSIVGLILILPLLHTELLPDRAARISIAPPTPIPPPRPVTAVQRASNIVASVAPVLTQILSTPRITHERTDQTPAPEASTTPFGMMGAGIASDSLLAGASSSVSPVLVTPRPESKAGPTHVSSGVVAGLLLEPIRPIYPPIAKAAHVEGTVVVEALISRSGTIESLHVLSGPAMLQSAAIEAIRNARYRPFQLNGSPVEVQTTITVNFRIGS